jgi:hypothetical protein
MFGRGVPVYLDDVPEDITRRLEKNKLFAEMYGWHSPIDSPWEAVEISPDEMEFVDHYSICYKDGECVFGVDGCSWCVRDEILDGVEYRFIDEQEEASSHDTPKKLRFLNRYSWRQSNGEWDGVDISAEVTELVDYYTLDGVPYRFIDETKALETAKQTT